MKVALVHDFLFKVGGAEKTLLAISEIFPDAPIYTLFYDERGTKSLFNDKKIHCSSLNKYPYFIKKRSKLLINKFPKAIEEFDFSGYDVVISDSNSYAHGVKTKIETFHLTYCYSPTRYLWDWYHEYLLENNISQNIIGVLIRQQLSKIRLWDKEASKRTNLWIAISKHVEKRIWKYYRQPSNIIYPPTKVDEYYIEKNPSEDYYLIVSRLSAYKKVDIAVKAFNKLGHKLKIVGEGSELNNLKSIANDNIMFLGWQNDQEVKKLFRNCKAFVFPGEEDFGLTPVESMASGRPVISLNVGGVKETVVDGKTGVFFDQPDENSLIAAVKKFENQYSKFNPEYIRKHAHRFSHQNFTTQFKKTLIHEYQKYLTSIADKL